LSRNINFNEVLELGSRYVGANIRRIVCQASRPFLINFAATYRCNGRCLMCNIWKTRAYNELSLEELQELVANSTFKKLRVVQITGGEAFLRPDIRQIVSLFYESLREPQISIATNALAPKRIFDVAREICEEVPRWQIWVSLDGLGQTHDRIRGIPGAFGMVMETCRLLRTLKNRYNSLRVGINFTLSNRNYRELESVFLLAREMDFGFSFGMVTTSGLYYGDQGATVQLPEAAGLEEVSRTVKKIIEYCGRVPWFSGQISKLYFRYLCDRMFQEGSRPSCFSGFVSFFMDPKGTVYPCIFMDRALGNVRQEPFDAIWTSAKANCIRQFVKHCANCWTRCESAKDIAFNFIKPAVMRCLLRSTERICRR